MQAVSLRTDDLWTIWWYSGVILESAEMEVYRVLCFLTPAHRGNHRLLQLKFFNSMSQYGNKKFRTATSPNLTATATNADSEWTLQHSHIMVDRAPMVLKHILWTNPNSSILKSHSHCWLMSPVLRITWLPYHLQICRVYGYWIFAKRDDATLNATRKTPIRSGNRWQPVQQ